MIGTTMLRVVVGGLFAGHGAQKLFGSFGGHGPDATGEAFEKMGLSPGKPMATLAGAAELTGGSLVALGAANPLGSAMLSGVMATAIEQVHLKNGPWVGDGGYEYPLVLMAVLFHLADEGPGPISLDRLFGKKRYGLGWAVAQLAAGVGGAMAIRAMALRRQQAQQQDQHHDQQVEPQGQQEQGTSPSWSDDGRAGSPRPRPAGDGQRPAPGEVGAPPAA